jgi:hypothetical protein
MSKRNRNRGEVFKAIFEKLVDAVSRPEFGDVVASSQLDDNKLKRKRFIRLDKDGRNWLTHTEVIHEPYFISPRVQALTLRFEGTHYFSMIGLEPNGINLHKDLPRTEPNAGLVAVILVEGRVPLRAKIDVLEIINSILPNYEGTDGYEGHDIDQVKSYFLPIEVYEISPNFVLTVEQLPRLVGLRLCQTATLSLPFSDDTLESLRKVFLGGSPPIPYENLVQCCYSVSWKHAFLEAYRCVERLYSVYALYDLYETLFPSGGNLNLIDFGKQIENTLKCRATEEDSALDLIKGSPQNVKDLLEKVKQTDTNYPPTMEVGKWFYQIRNNIVHFRPANEKINLTDPQWDELIRGTLGVIEFWYRKYESRLISESMENG